MKLVIFDLDGVIFDHLNFWDEIVKIYKTEKEINPLIKKYLHTNYPKLVDKLVEWGITSISVSPDRIEQTRILIAQSEAKLVKRKA